MLEQARGILARLRVAQGEVHALREGNAGVVRVGIFQGLGSLVSGALVRRFPIDDPGVQLQMIHTISDAELLEPLARGEIDLAFVTLPLEPGPLVVEELLAEELQLSLAERRARPQGKAHADGPARPAPRLPAQVPLDRPGARAARGERHQARRRLPHGRQRRCSACAARRRNRRAAAGAARRERRSRPGRATLSSRRSSTAASGSRGVASSRRRRRCRVRRDRARRAGCAGPPNRARVLIDPNRIAGSRLLLAQRRPSQVERGWNVASAPAHTPPGRTLLLVVRRFLIGG